MNATSLFKPLQVGRLQLPNRIVMAPLTRMRAGPGNVPSALNALYYAQRASAGLLIAEGTAVSPEGQGYPCAPGIYTQEQIAGWRGVTDAVHARGGRFFLQIAHNGRNSHSSFMPDGGPPLAPSAVASTLPGFTADFRKVPIETPRALQTPQIAQIVADFRKASRNAMEAGFDGVEIQGANSHLIEEFLDDGTNRRSDRYGGSCENRARFLLEIVAQVSGAIGAERVGVRLSPFGQYGGIQDTDPLHLFTFVIESLSKAGVAYLHLIEARGSEMGLSDDLHEGAVNNAAIFRASFSGPLISSGAYTPATAADVIEQKHADAVAFGRLFIGNPDLVERIRNGLPLSAPDRATYYGGAEHGYTDYEVFSRSRNQGFSPAASSGVLQ